MWIRIVIAATMAFVVGSGGSFAEEKEPSGEELILRAFRLPPVFFTRPDAANSKGARQEEPGIKVLPSPPNEPQTHRRLDVRGFLESMGAPLSAKSEAIYFEGASALVVRATEKELEILSSLGLGEGGCFEGPLVQVTFTLVQLSLEKPIEDIEVLSYANLRKMAGDSWQLVDRQVLTMKSGMRAMHAAGISNREHPFVQVKDEGNTDTAPEIWKPRSFSGDESGTRVTVEPVIGPDSLSIDVSLDYRHRSQAGENQAPYEHNLTTMTAAWDGYPVVLQFVQSNEPRGADGAQKYRALILKAQLVNFGGWPQRDPKSAVNSSPP